ncbi:hypothetical protein TRM7557_00793 [Tritonibacter multivorans]|uniref:Uncharacterized protein n=1 Tax=Tritonibacter multivorans TaxID=928856 RepID=A0A0N7LYZ7_9RHOB|nr:hypothetical protein [Tritonibacter multivorans]MDA7422840.1 hypothetical protein [Tritonibacter multivorans]CUH76257.1 hypothetical protein TRM7557_00793 [Tritonibacter multivorans]SFD61644.1 hypothetical protein SAMN04488049_11814 [Tritonibacter multivorans]
MHAPKPETAALLVLIVLQTVMLSALYAGIPPHPPVATPLFGIAPFIGASLAVAAAAIVLGPDHGTGRQLAVLAALMGLVSFGPQKYLDAQFALIWPAVMVGQAAVVTICLRAGLDMLRQRTEAPT